MAPNLPIVHVTPTWNAKEILKIGKLTTKRCPVFGRDLVYFFSLRPSYRTKIGSVESHQISRFPVAFVLRPEAVSAPLHVYPFDTGGAANGSFDSQADPYIPLEDYALEPKHEAISKFISWAFGNTENYLYGRLRPGLANEIEPFKSVAVSYIDIARLGIEGSNDHDTRASCIEIASSHNVDISGFVELIVAPKQFIEGNEPIFNLIKPLIKMGTKLELYDWMPNRSPNDYQDDLRRIVESWFKKSRVYQ